MKKRWPYQEASLKRAAFTLVEVTIYLALSSLLVYSAMRLLNQTSFSIMRRSSYQETTVRTVIFIDLLKRDLMQASTSCDHWVAQNGIFRHDTLNVHGKTVSTWVCWSTGSEGLIRSYGAYDTLNKVWLHKQADFFGCGVATLTIKPIVDQGHVIAAAVHYEKSGTMHQSTIPLMNKVIS